MDGIPQTEFKRTNVAGLLLNEKNQLLLCQRSSNKKFKPSIWHIPGGKQEDDETPEQTLKREFKEELNLIVTAMKSLETRFVYQDGTHFHCTLFYLVEATGEIQLDFENENFEFVDLTNLHKYLDESFSASYKAFSKALSLNS